MDLYLDASKTLVQREMFKPAIEFLNEALSNCEKQAKILRAQSRDEMKMTELGPIPWGDYAHLAVQAEGLEEKNMKLPTGYSDANSASKNLSPRAIFNRL